MKPVLLQLGPVSVRAYGTMLMVAFVVGILWMMREARHRGITRGQVVDCALWVLVGSIIGSRILFVLLNWKDYTAHPANVVRLDMGGMSFHGGFLGALVAGYIYSRAAKIPFARLLDTAAPSIPLGYAFARIGCYLNGCCRGCETTLPWAVRFPDAAGNLGPPVHPVQLYASLCGLAMFVVLLKLKPHVRTPGHLGIAFVVVYSVYRFYIEFLRHGVSAQPLWFLPDLTQAQGLSLVLIFGGLATILLWPPPTQPAPTEEAKPDSQKRRAVKRSPIRR